MSWRSARAFALAAAVAVGIGLQSFEPEPEDQKPEVEGHDKLKHALAYGALAWTTARALASTGRTARAAAGVAFVVASVYGGAIEVVQPLTGRTGSLADELANVAGALLGAAGFLGIANRAAARGTVAAAAASAAVVVLLAGAPGCASASGGGGAIELPTAEGRIREQAVLLRSPDADLVAGAYAAIEATVPRPERPFYTWLRVRLEPDRARRRAGLDELIEKAPDLVPALLEAGDLAFESGDRAAARRRWSAALEREPASPRALARLAWLDRSEERSRAAVAAAAAWGREGGVGEGVSSSPAANAVRPLPEGFLAGAHLTLGAPAGAREVLAAAGKECVDGPIEWMFGGLERLAAGDPLEASRLFERALLRAPRELVPLDEYIRATTARLDALVAGGMELEARELATAAAGRWPGVEPFRRAAERRRTWRVP